MRYGVNPLAADVFLFPRTEAQFERLRQHNRASGQSCLLQRGALMRNVDTATVARDHEALRPAGPVPASGTGPAARRSGHTIGVLTADVGASAVACSPGIRIQRIG